MGPGGGAMPGGGAWGRGRTGAWPEPRGEVWGGWIWGLGQGQSSEVWSGDRAPGPGVECVGAEVGAQAQGHDLELVELEPRGGARAQKSVWA